MQCGGWGLNGFFKRSSRLVSNGDYAWDSVLTHNARSGQLQLIVRGASVRKDEQILQNGVKDILKIQINRYLQVAYTDKNVFDDSY